MIDTTASTNLLILGLYDQEVSKGILLRISPFQSRFQSPFTALYEGQLSTYILLDLQYPMSSRCTELRRTLIILCLRHNYISMIRHLDMESFPI